MDALDIATPSSDKIRLRRYNWLAQYDRDTIHAVIKGSAINKLILVPAALYVLSKVGRLMKRASRRLLERMSSIYKILQETFQGIRVVKAYTMEPYERRR